MDEATKKLISTLREMTKLMKKRRLVIPAGIRAMTLGQLQVMESLCEHKRARMSDLAREAGVKLPTMTEIVDKLVKEEMLQRQREEGDRRTVWVTIAPRIQKFAKKMMKEHEKYIENIMSVLTEEEKKQATKIILKLINRLQKDINIEKSNISGGKNA